MIAVPPVAHKTVPATLKQVSRTGICRQHGIPHEGSHALWYWMLLGLVLLAGEMLLPGGLFALFFGLAALVIGVLVGVGVKAPNWLQWLLFSILSIVSLLLFRGSMLARLKIGQQTTPQMDTLVGEIVTLRDDLPPGAVGKAELRGTVWTVQMAPWKPWAVGSAAACNGSTG